MPGRLKIAVASGWAFNIRLDDYYIYTSDSTGKNVARNITAYNDYRIPFLAEAAYPLSGNINIEGRIKYNLNPENGDIWSAGIGLSLKL